MRFYFLLLMLTVHVGTVNASTLDPFKRDMSEQREHQAPLSPLSLAFQQFDTPPPQPPKEEIFSTKMTQGDWKNLFQCLDEMMKDIPFFKTGEQETIQKNLVYPYEQSYKAISQKLNQEKLKRAVANDLLPQWLDHFIDFISFINSAMRDRLKHISQADNFIEKFNTFQQNAGPLLLKTFNPFMAAYEKVTGISLEQDGLLTWNGKPLSKERAYGQEFYMYRKTPDGFVMIALDKTGSATGKEPYQRYNTYSPLRHRIENLRNDMVFFSFDEKGFPILLRESGFYVFQNDETCGVMAYNGERFEKSLQIEREKGKKTPEHQHTLSSPPLEQPVLSTLSPQAPKDSSEEESLDLSKSIAPWSDTKASPPLKPQMPKIVYDDVSEEEIRFFDRFFQLVLTDEKSVFYPIPKTPDQEAGVFYRYILSELAQAQKAEESSQEFTIPPLLDYMWHELEENATEEPLNQETQNSAQPPAETLMPPAAEMPPSAVAKLQFLADQTEKTLIDLKVEKEKAEMAARMQIAKQQAERSLMVSEGNHYRSTPKKASSKHAPSKNASSKKQPLQTHQAEAPPSEEEKERIIRKQVTQEVNALRKRILRGEADKWKPCVNLLEKAQNAFKKVGIDLNFGLNKSSHGKAVLSVNPDAGLSAPIEDAFKKCTSIVRSHRPGQTAFTSQETQSNILDLLGAGINCLVRTP